MPYMYWNVTISIMVNVTFYDQLTTDSLDSSSIKVIDKQGYTVTIQRGDDMTNDDVIDYFKGKNMKIRWVEPTNQIERKYLELIN